MTLQDQEQEGPAFAERVLRRLRHGLFVAAIFAILGLIVSQAQVDVVLISAGAGFVLGFLLGWEVAGFVGGFGA